VLLDDKNYNMWARQVSFGLIGNKKLEYVNDELIMPVPEFSKPQQKMRKKSSGSGEKVTIEFLDGF
jgi:hypothetical protein